MASGILEQALQFLRAGNFDAAEELSKQVVESEPSEAEAWLCLGDACLFRGRFGEAIANYERTLDLAPDHVAARNSLGVAFAQMNNWEQAARCFRQAVESQRDYAEGHNNLGIAVSNQGKLAEAERCYHEALRIKPDYAEALSNLGLVLGSMGKLPEAIAAQQRALQLRPDFAAAHDNLRRALTAQDQLNQELARFQAGNWYYMSDTAVAYNELGIAFKAHGRFTEAITSFQEAIRLRPGFQEAWNNLGITLKERGNVEEAEASLRQALALRPGDLNALNNLGTVLESVKKLDEAIGFYQEALRAKPDFAEAHNNLGVVLAKQGKYAQASTHYQRALELKPDYTEPYYNLGNALVDQAMPEQALQTYQRALLLDPRYDGARSNYLFCLNYLPNVDPEFVFAEHRHHGALYPAGAGPAQPRRRHPNEPLRVGYVSPDLRAHVLATFLELILVNHDPKQIQAIGYAEVPAPDETTFRLQGLCQSWRRTCGLSDEQVDAQVRADGIDILVDLAGHTAGNRLGVFARTPAPVQVTYLGYPNTTGLAAIDYRLTDAVADPPGEPSRHTEELFRLADGFCCFRPHRKAPAITVLPAKGAGHVTFGSLHKLPKLNSAVLDLWCTMLRAVPASRLLVCQHTLHGDLKEHFAKGFAARGMGPDRVEFRRTEIPNDDTPIHMNLYSEIDISLDTFPWGGHTTACESAWMGVPMLTLNGSTHAGRMVASVLTRVGLNDFIADTPAKYIELAVKFSGDLDRLAALRSRLRGVMQDSPLCDGKNFTRTLEEAYRSMWERRVGKWSG
jgi:predicted O-linked N-acetylglucosamine transferase (SPINDLY family)